MRAQEQLAGKPRTRTALALLTVLTTTLASASVAAPPDRTERLAAACNGCHGPEGRGSEAIPALRGQDASTLEARMQQWHAAADRDGSDHVMVLFARGLRTADLAPLARHYARPMQ